MKQYILNAFAGPKAAGNSAAVCILTDFPEDEWMTQRAIKNHFSETAFVVIKGMTLALRWFGPAGEVGLCGHATLAAAYVISHFYFSKQNGFTFQTRSGLLTVRQKRLLYEMNFPIFPMTQIPVTSSIKDAFGAAPSEAWLGRDLVCIMDSEETVRSIVPSTDNVSSLPGHLQHITARGTKFDCVSRSFCPKLHIPEDPACGSGHCHIIPYWMDKLHKTHITAYQASSRGGILYGEKKGNRLLLSGKVELCRQEDIL